MAGWNNRNCCCEPRAYTCADGEVNICCMTLQESGWAHAVSLYSPGVDPDDICSYVPVRPYYHNNICGTLQLIDGCTKVWAEVSWGIQADGTIRLRYYRPAIMRHNGTFWPLIDHVVTGLDPDTWYLSPLVFTFGGVTHTLTVCPDPHEPFPEWPISTVYMKVVGLSSEGRGRGTVLCGGDCDPLVNPVGHVSLQWMYDIETDTIKIGVSSVTHSGSYDVAYDDGNWVNGTHTFTISSLTPIFLDASVTVSLADSCDIPPPPPPCEVSTACFPDGCPCIVDGSDGSLYRDLVADVSGPVTHTELGLYTYLNEGWDYNQASPGTDSLVIRCSNGGLDPYYVAAVFGGVSYFFSIPAGGIDCDPADTNQILDITLTDGIITIRIYTI